MEDLSSTSATLVFSCDECSFITENSEIIKEPQSSCCNDDKKPREQNVLFDVSNFQNVDTNEQTENSILDGAQRYTCDQCSFSTRRLSSLKSHQNTHTDENKEVVQEETPDDSCEGLSSGDEWNESSGDEWNDENKKVVQEETPSDEDSCEGLSSGDEWDDETSLASAGVGAFKSIKVNKSSVQTVYESNPSNQSKIIRQSHQVEDCDKMSDIQKRENEFHAQDKPFYCEECCTSFFLLDSFKYHSDIKTKIRRCLSTSNYSCNYFGCIFTTEQQENLITHKFKVHSRDKPFQCGQCGSGFTLLSTLEIHNKHSHLYGNLLNHDNLSAHTQLLGEQHPRGNTVNSLSNLNVLDNVSSRTVNPSNENQVIKPSNKEKYEGKINESQKPKSQLDAQDKPYYCKECCKSFLLLGSLNSHLKKKCLRNSYSCNFIACVFETGQQENLITHKFKMHSTDKPFQCGQCGSGFAYLSSLKIHHKHTHSNENLLYNAKLSMHNKPHEEQQSIVSNLNISNTETFQKVVNGSNHLLRHKLTHSAIRRKPINRSEKKIHCKECNKNLRIKSFQSHVTKQHLYKTDYKCLSCDFAYSKKSYLMEHVNKVHPSEPNTAIFYFCKNGGCNFTTDGHKEIKSHIKLHACLRTNSKAKLNILHESPLTNGLNDIASTNSNKSSMGDEESLFYCDQCNFKTKHRNLFTSHLTVHTKSKCFLCEECNKKFANLENFNRHLEIHNSIEPHICKSCGTSYSTKFELKNHIRVVHLFKQSNVVNRAENTTITESDKNINNLVVVLSEEECVNKPAQTSLDGTIIKNKERSTITYAGVVEPNIEHSGEVNQQNNSPENSFYCEECGQKFNLLESLKAHEALHKKQEDLFCDVCGKCYLMRNHLIRHKLTHSANQSIPFNPREKHCEECNKNLTIKSFQNHVRKQHLYKTDYKCLSCDFAYSKKSYLMEHVNKVHLGEPNTTIFYFCKKAGCNFTTENHENIKAHIKLHTCSPENGKAKLTILNNKSPMTNEAKVYSTNTNESSLGNQQSLFYCDKCNFKTKQRNCLMSHLKGHTKRNYFRCEECIRKFTSFEYLNRHLEIHNSRAPHKCHACGSSYFGKYNLKVHIRRAHLSKKSNMIKHAKNSTATVPKKTANNPFLALYEEECVDEPSQTSLDAMNCRDKDNSDLTSAGAVDPNIGHSGVLNQENGKSSENVFYCEQCGQKFNLLESLKAHEAVHKKPELCCDVCGKRYLIHNQLIRHKLTHSNKTVVNSGSTQDNCMLSTEKTTHLDKITFNVLLCEECDVEYPNVTALVDHLKTHSCLKKCHICDKSLSSLTMLKGHIRTHSDKLRFKCNVCSLMFVRKDYLRNHIFQVHPNENMELLHIIENYDDKKKLHCGECNKSIVRSGFNRHVRNHLYKIEYKCISCGLLYAKKLHLTEHVNKVHPSDPNTSISHLCRKKGCNFMTKEQIEIEAHIKLHSSSQKNAEAKSTILKENPLSNNDIYSTNTNKYSLGDQQPLFYCELCDFRTNQKDSLTSHVKVHATSQWFRCEVCKRQFVNFENLNRHLETHDKKKLHKCQACDSSYFTKFELKEHIRIVHLSKLSNEVTHAENATITVPDKISNILFVLSEECLDEPSETENNSKLTSPNIIEPNIVSSRAVNQLNSFYCEECGEKFNLRESLNAHQAVHKQNEELFCDVCGKRYLILNNLIRHKLTHSNPTVYTCKYCGQQCTSSIKLKYHKRKHSNKPSHNTYPCQECDFVAKTKPHLNQHKLTHIDGPKHLCDECGASFKQPRYLYTHKKVCHSEEQTFKCSKCDYTAKAAYYVQTHERKHHPYTGNKEANSATMDKTNVTLQLSQSKEKCKRRSNSFKKTVIKPKKAKKSISEKVLGGEKTAFGSKKKLITGKTATSKTEIVRISDRVLRKRKALSMQEHLYDDDDSGD